MVKKRKSSKSLFRLPKLRKRTKTKVRKVIIRERISRAKPIGQVLTERKKRTQERISIRRMR